MESLIQYHQVIAIFIARVFLGLLFFFQGYDAVFTVKISRMIDAYRDDFSRKNIPGFVTVAGVWFASLSELAGGFLLVFGLFTSVAYILVGLNLIFAALAFSINTPMWDTHHVMPRLLLLILLLIVPPTWNAWSLDNLLFNH